jgi:hypothetical protein
MSDLREPLTGTWSTREGTRQFEVITLLMASAMPKGLDQYDGVIGEIYLGRSNVNFDTDRAILCRRALHLREMTNVSSVENNQQVEYRESSPELYRARTWSQEGRTLKIGQMFVAVGSWLSAGEIYEAKSVDPNTGDARWYIVTIDGLIGAGYRPGPA